MKLICATEDHKSQARAKPNTLAVVLYGRADKPTKGSAGAAIKDYIIGSDLDPAPRAWDFLSLALAVIAADLAGHRRTSPDGWTREFELEVAVVDSAFWNSQREVIQSLLGFLTTDIWKISFIDGGYSPQHPKKPFVPPADCVSLLSGGLDSLVGNLDLVSGGKRPFAVSQVVRGDAENQIQFAKVIGGGLPHLQMNHNAEVPNPETPSSQRARSLIFIAYGVLAATTLKGYGAESRVTLYLCENGFISINPPLTEIRLGSLSTRTTHPVFLKHIRRLLESAGLRVDLENPYQLKTKGEMLRNCADQKVLRTYATKTTSCGRFLINGYMHCGRCVPCLVRRAAFRAAKIKDDTRYKYSDLGRDDSDYSGFDDVRSVAMAITQAKAEGLETWLGTALSTALIGDVEPFQAMVGRGLDELKSLIESHGVK